MVVPGDFKNVIYRFLETGSVHPKPAGASQNTEWECLDMPSIKDIWVLVNFTFVFQRLKSKAKGGYQWSERSYYVVKSLAIIFQKSVILS